MRVIYTDRVILRNIEEDGTYTAMSIKHNQVYRNCRVLTPNPDNITYPRLGKHALLIQVDDTNLIIGYYNEQYEDAAYDIYLEGEQILSCGESRAFILGDNGYVGIYYIRRNEDGSLEKTPLVEYDGDDELSATFSKMVLSMATGVYANNIETNSNGYTEVDTMVKGSTHDMGSRYRKTIKATPNGMSVKTMVDCTPNATRTAPELTPQAVPVRVEISHDPQAPLKVSQYMGAIEVSSVNTDAAGNLTISCGMTPATQATMAIDVTTGAMSIDAPGGIEIKGVNQSLIQTIQNHILNWYNNHVHNTSVGPSTPPLFPDLDTPIKLTTIKGVAH